MIRPAVRLVPALSLLAAAAAPRALHAQPATDPAPVVAVVQALLDGISRRDTTGLRALFLPGMRFVSIAADRAGATPRWQTGDEMLRELPGETERLLERMWAPVVHVQGPIATVWTPYDFHVDGKFSHCGIDTAHLVRTAEGWRIADFAYTVQRTGCAPSPLGAP